MKEKLRKKIAEKRAAAKRILDAVASLPETRDLNPEEQSQFDGLMADVENLKKQVALSEQMEADDQADAPAPAERSERRSAPIGEAPAIHTRKRNYSFLRALRMAAEGRQLDGLEGEVSGELQRRAGRSPRGFFMPTSNDPEIRALMYPGRAEQRADFTTTAGAGTIFTAQEGTLIDLLRAKLVVASLGATYLNDMVGPFAIPRQTGTASVYWLAEGGSSATASAPSTDQVGFSPKTALAAVNLTRQLLDQTSLDAEQFVKNDLASALARDLDRVALIGGGTNEPVGISANSTIATNSAALQGGTNGAALTYPKIIAMESQVGAANADYGTLAYVTNPKLRGWLKGTLQFSSAGSATIWQKGEAPGIGEVNGYRALATTTMPSNLTKGSASGVCSSIIYGNFASLVVAMWPGVDVIVNPFTNQLNGGITISMGMSVDVKVRHEESFAVIKDALLT